MKGYNTTFDVEDDDLIELPEVAGVDSPISPDREYSRMAQGHVDLDTRTRPCGGARHSDETRCLMRGVSAHWSNTDIFGATALSELIIWNR